jgi:hypothetical protein
MQTFQRTILLPSLPYHIPTLYHNPEDHVLNLHHHENTWKLADYCILQPLFPPTHSISSHYLYRFYLSISLLVFLWLRYSSLCFPLLSWTKQDRWHVPLHYTQTVRSSIFCVQRTCYSWGLLSYGLGHLHSLIISDMLILPTEFVNRERSCICLKPTV